MAPIRAAPPDPSAHATPSWADGAARASTRASTCRHPFEPWHPRLGPARSCHGCSSLLPFPSGFFTHAIEMALERIDLGRPVAAELSEPSIHFHERLRPDPVQPALRIDT